MSDIEKHIGEAPENAPRVEVVRPVKKSRKGRAPAAKEVIVQPAPVAAAVGMAVQAEAPAVAPAVAARKTKPQEPEAAFTHPKDEPSGSALVRWPLVIEWMRTQGYDADAVVIRLVRTQLGQFATTVGPVEMPGGIDGALVAGNEQLAAADALSEAITEMYHLVGHRKGAAQYRCIFAWKNPPARLHGGSTICWGTFTLDDPEIVMEQRRRAQAFALAQQTSAPRLSPRPMGYALPSAPGGYASAASGGYAPPVSDPAIEAIRRDLAAVLGERGVTSEIQALLERHFAALPMQAPQPPPPAAPQLSEEDRRYIEEGRFRAMAERMGYIRLDQVPPPAVPPPPTPPPAQVVASGVTDPMGGLETLLRGFEQFEKFKPRFARLAGLSLPEEGEEVPEAGPPPKIEDTNPLGLQEVPITRFMGQPIMMPTKADGWVEWIQGMAGANPAIMMEALNRLSNILSSPAFAKVIERFTGQGGAHAQAAQQIQAQGVVGRGTQELTNGAAVRAALEPLVPPPAPAPPPPFRGPMA